MKIIFAFDFVTPIYDNSGIIPIGLLSLATIVKENGYDVEVVDLNAVSRELGINSSDERNERLAAYIAGKEPAVVGFPTMCGSFHNILLLTRQIKRLEPKIKVILGGPQVSSVPQGTLDTFAWIDLIVIGEAERHILQVIGGLESGVLGDVLGVAYRENGQVVLKEPAALVEDLDGLPMLDYQLIAGHKWRVTMEVSRGCPYRCVFCNTSAFWQRKFRIKSVPRIEQEIRAIKSMAGGDPVYITFIDDNFTTDYRHCLRLCEKLRELDIAWNCDARVDTLDEPLIAAMAEAGCDSILMGIETGSPRVQKLMNKNIDLTTVDVVIDLLQRYKLKPVLSFMYGLPDETDEDVQLTLAMIYRMLKKGVFICTLHSLSVLAGTKLYEQCADRLVLRDYYSDMTDAAGFEVSKELVRDNPALFSHFYTLTDSTADRYQLLDRFTNYVLIKLYPYFSRTLDEIIGYFQGNILSLYQDFVAHTDGFADFFRNREHISSVITEKSLSKRMIGYLTSYIGTKYLYEFHFTMIFDIIGKEITALETAARGLHRPDGTKTGKVDG